MPEPEIINWEIELDSAFAHHETVDVWKIPLIEFNSNRNILSDDEMTRLGKFQSGISRSVFYSSRVYLRTILSEYSNIAPEELRFSKQESGKPFLIKPDQNWDRTSAQDRNSAEDRNQESHIEFNLSHSGELVLLAVSRFSSVGIDVEKNRFVKNWESIARKVFSETQLAKLYDANVPEEKFTELWTEFEASQKLCGNGVFGKKPGMDSIKLERFIPLKDYLACLAYKTTPDSSGVRFFDGGSLETG